MGFIKDIKNNQNNNFSESIIEIAKTICDYIERVVGEKGLDNPVEMYLAGGAAVNFYVSQRVSDDVDAVFSHKIMLPQEITSFYRDNNGSLRKVSFDQSYNDSLSLMHPDYKEDSLIVKEMGSLIVKALNPEDLVISKLSRFAENDQSDIKMLIHSGLVNKERLVERFKEASKYYIFDQHMINSSLSDVLDFFESKKDDEQSKTAGFEYPKL